MGLVRHLVGRVVVQVEHIGDGRHDEAFERGAGPDELAVGPQVGPRQRTAVELAVGGGGQRVEDHDRGGDHVIR